MAIYKMNNPNMCLLAKMVETLHVTEHVSVHCLCYFYIECGTWKGLHTPARLCANWNSDRRART